MSGGEVFEFYVRRNAAALAQSIPPQTFSSDPTKNTAIDSVHTEHFRYITSGTPNRWGIEGTLYNFTSDTAAMWTGYDVDTAFFDMWIEPACDNVTVMCPDPNLVTSNHGLGIATIGRDLFKAVSNVLSSVGPAITAETNVGGEPNYTCVNARIDNNTWSFVQESTDFSTVRHERTDGQCAPTDGEDFSGPHHLKRLEIKRYHRPKYDYMPVSSFGIGVFSEFDINLTIYPGASGQETVISMFDPRSDAPPLNFHETSTVDGDSTVNGIYHDRSSHAYKSLRLLDATGQTISNPRQATKVKVTKWNGESMAFEVIKTEAGVAIPASLGGRLIEFRDRSNNVYSITYVYPASATDAQVSYDRTWLWAINTVTDMSGVTATFTVIENFNRKVVQDVNWQEGTTWRDVNYGYSWDDHPAGPDRLLGVGFGDSANSKFEYAWDSSAQAWEYEFDDVAGEGNGQNHLYVDVSGAYYQTPDGVVHNQPAGLVRRVINGNIQRVYQNWEDPHDPKTTYFVEGEGPPASRFTRLKVNQAGATLEVARAPAPAFASDPFTATYTIVESHTPTAMGLVGTLINALNQATTIARSAVSGNVTSVTTALGASIGATFNGNARVTKQTDALGVVTSMTYDSADNLLTMTTASGTPRAQTWTYTYNSRGLMTSVTNPMSVTTNYGYDSNGNLTSVTEPSDVVNGTRPVRTFEYDNLGRRKAEVDAAGRRTTFSYDIRGRMVKTTYPDGTSDIIEYGAGSLSGMITEQDDRNGVARRLEYDYTRRVTKKVSSVNGSGTAQDTFEYSPGRYLLSAVVNAGTRKQMSYDLEDRVNQKVVYATNTKTLTYKSTWDANDHLTLETDPYNRKTYYLYDSDGRLTRKATELVPGGISVGANIANLTRITTSNPAYIIEDAAYDIGGRVSSRTDERGIQTTYGYDELRRVTQQVEAAGTATPRTTSYTYDAANNKLTEVGPRSTTKITYTRRNKIDSITEAFGKPEAATTSRTYTLTGEIKTLTDGKGGVTTLNYATTADLVVSKTDPAGFVTSYTYDPMGHMLTMTDPNAVKTTYQYDGRYRPTKEIDGLNQSSDTVYDDNASDGLGLDADSHYSAKIAALGFGANSKGRAYRVGNPAGEVRLAVVDGLGRRVLEVDPLFNATTTSYDTVVNGLVEVTTTNALGKTTIKRMDARGRVREEVDADGNVTKNGFDPVGHQLSTRDPNNIGFDCVFNNLGQRTSCTNTATEKTSWGYDLDGNVIATTDPNGNVSSCVFDARNRKSSCMDRLNGTRGYGYDGNSNLVTTRDAQLGVTTFEYDARNLPKSVTYPDATTDKITFTFDAGGRLSTTQDQSGNILTNTYDAANRLTKTAFPDGLNDTFTYDGASRLKTAASARYGVTTTEAYDAAGHLTSDTTNIGGVDYRVSATFDAVGRPSSMTYPDTKQLNLFYGLNRDLVTEYKLGTTTSLAKYTYDAGSRVKTTTLGNTLVETRTYQTNGNLISQLSTGTVGTLTYTYDKNGNRLTEGGTAAGGNQSFGYDKEDRVTSFTGPALTQSWSLSAEGDWNTTTRNSVVETRNHNAVHMLTAVASIAMIHDARGNLTTDDKQNRLAWDFSNRLKQYKKSGGITIDFLYDALGRRVGRKVGTATTVYVPYGSQMVAEYKNGALVTDYFYAWGTDNLLAYLNAGSLFWLSKDYLNTVKAVTNEGGLVSERYRYTAYGDRTILSASGSVISATTVNNFVGFTGRPHDVDTGLVDFRSRQYSPRFGRFISRDSAGYTDGPSLYRGYFVPNGTDPTGHWSLRGVVGAIGGGLETAYDHTLKPIVDPLVDGGRHLLDEGFELAGDIGDAIYDGAKYLGTGLWAGAEYLGRGFMAVVGAVVYFADIIIDDPGIVWRAIKRDLERSYDGIKWFAHTEVGIFLISWGIEVVGTALISAALTPVLGQPAALLVGGFIAGTLSALTEDALRGKKMTWKRFIKTDLLWGGFKGTVHAVLSPGYLLDAKSWGELAIMLQDHGLYDLLLAKVITTGLFYFAEHYEEIPTRGGSFQNCVERHDCA